MKGRICFMAVFLLIVMIGLPFSAWAHGGHHEHSWHASLEDKFYGQADFLIREAKNLGLTNEQVQTIKDKRFEIQRQDIQSDAQMAVAMLGIQKQLDSDAPNMDQLNVLIDNKMEVKKTLMKTFAQGGVDIKNILTPEQKTKAREILEEYHRR